MKPNNIRTKTDSSQLIFKTKCLVVGGLLTILSSGAATAQPSRDTVYFDPELFGAAIYDTFDSNVKGFAFAIADRYGIQARTSGGDAQAPGDGDIRMHTGIYSGLGSVSKMLSGIALLNLFDKHILSDASVQEQLDMKIWPMLPQKWQDEYAGTNVADITYRQLLQHRSGFRISSAGQADLPASASGHQMQYMLSQDVNSWEMGVRLYNNFNFTILKFLIPAIAYPDDVAVIHDFYQSLDIDTYSIAINALYGLLYEYYMVQEIFPNAIDEPIIATCRPVQELDAGRYAKHYVSASSAVGGVLNTNGNYCISQGSWYFPALDLARFVRTYAFTNNYIGPTTRASLYDPNAPGDRLLYNFTIMNSGFATAQTEFAYHGGTQDGYRAALVALPYDFYGVGLINSREFGSRQVAQAILDAFEDAIEDTPPILFPKRIGTVGFGGWFVSDVLVEWTVSDPESVISSSIGCTDSWVKTDTDSAGQLITCTATSAGGTASETVKILRDATAPSTSVTGAEDGDSFAAIDPPTIGCVAYDPAPGSGIVDPNPSPMITDDGGGFFTAKCTAKDGAGNTQDSVSVSYKLVSLDIIDDEITSSSLNQGNQSSLLRMLGNIQKKLDKGQIAAAVSIMMAFEAHVRSLIAEGNLPLAEGQALLDDIRVLISHYSS